MLEIRERRAKEFNMKLFVRNLSYDLSDDELKKVFEEVGEVASAKIITDRYTGRSRGFGFVEMSNNDDAQKAIDELNGKDVGGRALVVDQARDNDRR